ncbi:hypothetical protein KC19_3G157500 [Ceratodon purpureus]|uniref:Uncharacterized protein n=1 Tax=Ceratodon purpureus TaxID=3225 RepID=A0A8T0IMN3_CERPU|nr:hypothetical protein KC19_3G157500 [Ceratodon purpureus]
MACKSFSATMLVVVVIALMSLGMQSVSVMAQLAPAPVAGPVGAEAPMSGVGGGAVPLSWAGVLISVLAFAAGFAHL